MEALTQIVQEQPQNPRAWFALGQTFAGMKQWRLAEQAYHETVSHERDATVLSKAWLGIGQILLAYFFRLFLQLSVPSLHACLPILDDKTSR